MRTTYHALHCARKRVKDTRAVYRLSRGTALAARTREAIEGALRCRRRYHEALRHFAELMKLPVEKFH